jgi:carbon storage regulator
VLTTKAGEEIQMGDEIVVSVVRTSGGRVRLGIDAPRNVSIRRRELPSEDPDRISHREEALARKSGRVRSAK